MSFLLAFGSALLSGHILGGWRCRLNLSMFLLTISVGRFLECPICRGVECDEEKLEDHVRHREGFLNCSVSYGLPCVGVLYPER